MKKIKLLIDYSPVYRTQRTGIPNYVEGLHDALTEMDSVIIEKTFRVSKYIPSRPWKLFRFFEKTLYHDLYLPFKLWWGDYDVYVENQYMFTPLFKPKNTLVVTFIFDIALVLFDSIQTRKHTDNWRNQLPLSIKKSDILLTISASSMRDIAGYLDSIGQSHKPLDYIYPAVELESTEQSDAIAKYLIPNSYFLCLGTLEPRKNLMQVLRAFHCFKKNTGDHTKLVFAGKRGWLYKDIFSYIRTNGLESEVIFTGYVSDAEKIELLKCAKAFLFLPVYEGFGIPPLEAVKLGTATLVSDIAVFRELFEDNVYYADPEDHKDIARMILKVIEKTADYR